MAMANFSRMKNPVYTPDKLQKLEQMLASAKHITITVHRNPDGDAMGSALALFNFLKTLGHKSNVVVPNDYPEFLNWIPGNENVIRYEAQTEPATEILKKTDLLFCLDFNDLKRVGDMNAALEELNMKMVFIDHHEDPKADAELMFVHPPTCSTAQMIYELIEAMDKLSLLNPTIGQCIYCGLITDTGSFRYPSVTPKTLRIAAHLVEIGVEHELVYRHLFDNNSEMLLKMRGHLISKKLVVLPDYKTAYISFTREEQHRFHTKPGDTEGLVNIALSIKGVVMAAFFKEDNKQIRISFRSLGDFSVNELAAAHFSGGGHHNAAGGVSDLGLKETIEKFVEVLPNYQEKLNESE
jgi:bifunctional oligoribonuclease and PAP phosphatase NrnA